MKWYALLFVLLFSGSVFAFSVNVPEETIVVPSGGSRQVDIQVASNINENITVTILEAYPWISQSTSIMKMNANTQTLSVYLSPFTDTASGVYKITLLIESLKTEEQQKKYMYIRINRFEGVEVGRVTIGGDSVPNGQITVSALIKNYKPGIVENLKIISSISSPTAKLVEFEQNIDSIDPGETKNITYSFMIPRYAESGLYVASMKVIADEITSENTGAFTIKPDATFVKETSRQPNFFGFRKVILVTNIGNMAKDATISETLSGLDAAFYSGEQPFSKTNNEFVWVLRNIEPRETRTLYYNVDYSSAVLFAAVLAGAIWFFFTRIRALRIKKFILEKKFIEEGEEFTVGVEVMNFSGSKIESSTVHDFVPSVFEIKDGEGPKPVRKKLPAGTELTWHVKDLHKNEERILSYKIIPIFGIHGTIRLPRAGVKTTVGKKTFEKRSTYALIGVDMENFRDKKKK